MTTFLLIRHASHDLLGRTLAGRAPDLHLNARGKMEAERLAERLDAWPVAAIYTSPLERAQETAWPLATRLRLEARVNPSLHEIDFGEWTGRSFAELAPIPEWQRWNRARSRARATGGESMQEVQERIAGELRRLRAVHGDATLALVSHGDVIKAALLEALGTSLDAWLRIEISPASVSVVTLGEGGAQITLVNDTGILGAPPAARWRNLPDAISAQEATLSRR